MRYDKSAPCSQDPKNALLVTSLVLAQSGFRVESAGDRGIEVRGPGIQHSNMDPLHGVSYLRIRIENETIHLEANLEARAWIRNGIYLAFLVFGVMFFGVAILTNDVAAWTLATILSSSFLFVLLFFWSLQNNTIETLDSLLRKMQTDGFPPSPSSAIRTPKSCHIEDTTNRIAPAGGEVSNREENEAKLPEESVSSYGPEEYRENITGTFPHLSKPLDSPDLSRVSSGRNVQIGTPETPLHPDRPMRFETEVPYSRDPKTALLMARSILTHTDFRIESFDDNSLDAYGSGLPSGKKRPNAQEGISRLRIRIANKTLHFHVELGHAFRKRRRTMLASSVALLLFGAFALISILTGNYWGALLPLWPGLILFLAIRSLDRYVHESAHEFIHTLSQNMRFGGDVSS